MNAWAESPFYFLSAKVRRNLVKRDEGERAAGTENNPALILNII